MQFEVTDYLQLFERTVNEQALDQLRTYAFGALGLLFVGSLFVGWFVAGLVLRPVGRITRVAQETATEIRLLSRFLEKQGVKSNLIGQLRRIEQQMLPGLHSHSDFDAPDPFNALTPTEKWELVLFFKEALNNIVKHAHATHVEICTRADAKQLYLEISDNGQGMPEDQTPPVHLAKRANKLHAQLEISSAKNEGTTLQLCIPKKRRNKK